MVPRTRCLATLKTRLATFPVVGLIGARQAGKSTLARMLAETREGPVTSFDLEDPRDLARLQDPMLALRDLVGLVVLDEVQRRPDLFPVLRVLADREGVPARFLVLGSAGPELLRQSSESLAGRISYVELNVLAMDEVGAENLDALWVRGGFPRSYLAGTPAESFQWRLDFVRTFLERDLPQLGAAVASTTMRRFWTMLAHSHGETWNASEMARNFGVADTTARRYLDLLTATFVVTQLHPWHENLKKRQVKTPKVYLSDSGLLHALLGLEGRRELEGHPKVGASWEGFAIENIRQRLGARREETYFWATHAGAELDLLVVRGRTRIGFEIKRTVSPRTTRSMRTALGDLRLDRLDVVHAGEETFPLDERIRALPLRRVWEDLRPL